MQSKLTTFGQGDRQNCLQCKVIPRDSVATQHKLLILDLRLQARPKVKKAKAKCRIKWWILKEDNVEVLPRKLLKKQIER